MPGRKFMDDETEALLLNIGNPNLKIKEPGGTGRTHNRQMSRKIVEQAPIPVFLAGGLDVGDVKQALDTIRPFSLDVCSSEHTNGVLDSHKLDSFMKNALSPNLHFGKAETLYEIVTITTYNLPKSAYPIAGKFLVIPYSNAIIYLEHN